MRSAFEPIERRRERMTMERKERIDTLMRELDERILLLDGADSTVFSEAVDAFRSRDPEAVLRLLKEGDAITRAIKFATEQVDDAKDAIAGVPLGGTEALLDDLADAVVARDR